MRNELDHISACPIPPGELLEEELEFREISVADFAPQIGLAEADLPRLIAGGLVLTPALAASLEAALGIKAYIWLGLEGRYRRALARRAEILERMAAQAG
jgi:plasmid maintenance system antidote protein VapI